VVQQTAESFDSVRLVIVDYVMKNHSSDYTSETLPLDESLVELGILDSYGVVELVIFIETAWSFTIADSEITRQKLGSINKMTNFVLEKISAPKYCAPSLT
jgi:acyl carrier protein